jgi:hypothetical protein
MTIRYFHFEILLFLTLVFSSKVLCNVCDKDDEGSSNIMLTVYCHFFNSSFQFQTEQKPQLNGTLSYRSHNQQFFTSTVEPTNHGDRWNLQRCD